MVDTSLVADLVLYAVRDAFDIAVIFSGDLDLAPGLAAVQALGKRAWIATFGELGLSRGLTRSAWAHIDLLQHLDAFSYADLSTIADPHVTLSPETPERIDEELVRELRRAEAHFAAGGGFVGAHYFIHRWKGHAISDAPEERRLALQRLLQQGQVETYQVDGKTALKCSDDGTLELPLMPTLTMSRTAADDDEQTVELKVPDAVLRRGEQAARLDNLDDEG